MGFSLKFIENNKDQYDTNHFIFSGDLLTKKTSGTQSEFDIKRLRYMTSLKKRIFPKINIGLNF